MDVKQSRSMCHRDPWNWLRINVCLSYVHILLRNTTIILIPDSLKWYDYDALLLLIFNFALDVDIKKVK
jgi:hypothetical protein